MFTYKYTKKNWINLALYWLAETLIVIAAGIRRIKEERTQRWFNNWLIGA